MSKPIIGPTLRRLRTAQGLSQQALAQKLGISTSYLNLIEHDQRSVTANLLFKLAKILDVDLDSLSGDQERDYEIKLREVFADPLLGTDPVPEAEMQAIAARGAQCGAGDSGAAPRLGRCARGFRRNHATVRPENPAAE